MIFGGLLLAAVLALGAAWLLVGWRRRARAGWLRGLCLAIAAVCVLGFWVLLVGAGARGWFIFRPRPAPIAAEPIFEGVTYTREVQTRPWPMIVHLIRVDLGTPGVRVTTTPGDPTAGHEFRAMTPSEFLTRTGAEVAINGGFFSPYHSNGPWDYYPHSGDPVDVNGLSVYEGHRTSRSARYYWSLVVSRENQARIEDHATTGYMVISGLPLHLDAPERISHNPAAREPMTAVALDASSRTLMLFVVDGRQPRYSEGATPDELAEVIRRHGGARAIRLDGGGSSALVVRGRDGRPRLLSEPIHTRIPGRERPVANHLGILARELDSGSRGATP